jgi:hypothetical protein
MHRLRILSGLVVAAVGGSGAVWLWLLAVSDQWPGEIAGMIVIMGLVVFLIGLGLVAFDQ